LEGCSYLHLGCFFICANFLLLDILPATSACSWYRLHLPIGRHIDVRVHFSNPRAPVCLSVSVPEVLLYYFCRLIIISSHLSYIFCQSVSFACTTFFFFLSERVGYSWFRWRFSGLVMIYTPHNNARLLLVDQVWVFCS
jgi:hypothetical protein